MSTTLSIAEDLDPRRTAFFLDFDGTLADIVDNPADAAANPATLDLLGRLAHVAEGAVAVVSGRSIDQLDAMLHPLRLPLAGVHGLERRDGEGLVHRVEIDTGAHATLANAVGAFADARPGLLAEVKPGSVALHFRKRPELEAECRALAEDLAQEDTRISLVEGKKVIEMKLGVRTKADAVAAFLAEPPFRDKLPFFAGDDVTDEAAFSLVNERSGVSVKIGAGETAARFRLAGPAALAMEFAQMLEADARMSL